ncbi:capsular biosynthesis protein, partial [Acinetobacter baumannii]
ASRIPGRYEIQTSIIDDLLVDLELVKEKPLTEEEINWYEDYKSNINKIEPDYMKQNGLDNVSLLNKVSSNIFYKIIRSIKADIKYGAKSDYASGLLFLRILSAVKVAVNRRLNHKKTKKYFLKMDEVNEIKQQHKFYVYPMHYHPESSTSVLAPQYTNEYHNILNISNNLPFGQYLYVKDHRSAIGLNSDEFYRKISALPAVRLIPAEYNIKDLIKYSAGVITVNSTAGYEALILGKPVYLLGNVFYQNFSNVVRLENFNSLKSCLEKPTEFIENAADIVAYRRVTYEGILNFNMIEYDSNKVFFDKLAMNIQENMLGKT